MLKTGKSQSEGQAFHRRLLSEYNTDFTLSNYVAYFELKPMAKAIEQLRLTIEKHQEGASTHRLKPVDSVALFNGPPTAAAVDLSDPVLQQLRAQRERLQDAFFYELHQSYRKVKAYLVSLENDIAERTARLRQLDDAAIRGMDPNYIPHMYLKLESILKYRSLNLMAFRKILIKFLARCACDSLELQRRVYTIDTVISKSSVACPTLDLRVIALHLIAVYGTVFRLNFEEAVGRLSEYECRSGLNGRRILPNSDTFYFTNAFPHQERPGSFAIRVLAGSESLFAEKMITEVLQCPRYPGQSCKKFANGEVRVNLEGAVRGDDVYIVQSMVQSEANSNSSAIMELALMINAAKLAAAKRITAVIPYLAYTRNVASSAALAEMLELMGCQHVVTVDVHSEQVEGMFSVPMECISAKYEFVRFLTNQLKHEGHDFHGITIVAPKGEFVGRAKDFADAMMTYNHLDCTRQFVSVCTAVKRVKPALTPLKPPTAAPPMLDGEKPTSVSSPSRSAFNAMEFGTPLHHRQRVTPARAASTHDMNFASYVPASPTLSDASIVELTNTAGQHSLVPDDSVGLTRSGSTIGMERALRRQEEGRRSVVTQRIETTQNEYKDIVLVGDVAQRLCIIIDTVIDEALNISQVARRLQSEGAARIILVATHGVLSGRARERLIESPIELVVVTDSVNLDDELRDPRLARMLRVVPIAPLLARSIEKIHTENVLPNLFER